MMIRKQTLYFFLFLTIFSTGALASQSQDSTDLTSKFDELSYQWDQISDDLEKYEGLSYYCQEDSFRAEVIDILNQIHHFDTLIYNRLMQMSYYDPDKEIQKTLSQIQQFETEYNITEFIKHLSVECKERREVEKERKNTISDIGGESYSGQAYNVQVATGRYLRHVTKLVDHIREHIHHLNLEDSVSLYDQY